MTKDDVLRLRPNDKIARTTSSRTQVYVVVAQAKQRHRAPLMIAVRDAANPQAPAKWLQWWQQFELVAPVE